MAAKTQLNMRLPASIIDALKIRAQNEGVSLTALVTSFLKKELDLDDTDPSAQQDLEARIDALEEQVKRLSQPSQLD